MSSSRLFGENRFLEHFFFVDLEAGIFISWTFDIQGGSCLFVSGVREIVLGFERLPFLRSKHLILKDSSHSEDWKS